MKKISGFDLTPQGKLLQQVISNNELGYAYERSVGYKKDSHSHDFLNLAFPRGSSVVKFKTTDSNEYRVTSNSFLLMKENIEHIQSSETTIWDNFALFPSKEIIENLNGTSLIQSTPDVMIFNRTQLLDAVITKLFQNSVMDEESFSKLKNTYEYAIYLILEEIAQDQKTQSRVKHKPLASRAAHDLVQYIECNLFDSIEVESMVAHFGMSRATLYRKFKELTGHSIKDFIKGRRLEEAKSLIQKGEHTVAEIAYLVGFSEPRSFSTSYKKAFGDSPTKHLPS